MAIQQGLTMAIANPSQDLLMNAAFASDMLLHKPESDIRYINRMQVYERHLEEKEAAASPVRKKSVEKKEITASSNGIIYDCVMKGDKKNIVDHVKAALAEGKTPGEIINGMLIPAINDVGKKFEQQIYFLPQLISSASAMQTAISHLEPLLQKDGNEEAAATIIMATVEGDIHDIGKNLVVLMLKNYGYRVIDLGKDVATEKIVETAMAEHAQIVGLSALMTTTMMRMKDVVELAKEKGYDGKIIIGGACITQSFADEIGADGYSGDAADCVKLVQRLLAE